MTHLWNWSWKRSRCPCKVSAGRPEVNFIIIKTHPQKVKVWSLHAALTGVQLEEQLDREVVEVATVLDDLDEGSQPTLA